MLTTSSFPSPSLPYLNSRSNHDNDNLLFHPHLFFLPTLHSLVINTSSVNFVLDRHHYFFFVYSSRSSFFDIAPSTLTYIIFISSSFPPSLVIHPSRQSVFGVPHAQFFHWVVHQSRHQSIYFISYFPILATSCISTSN